MNDIIATKEKKIAKLTSKLDAEKKLRNNNAKIRGGVEMQRTTEQRLLNHLLLL